MAMPFSRPVLDADTPIDFYAGSVEAIGKLLPVWYALPEARKGTFYASHPSDKIQVELFENDLPGSNPLVITNPADLAMVFYAGEERAFILIEFEHHKQTRGLLSTVSLFLCCNPKDLVVRKAFSEKYQKTLLFSDPRQAAASIIEFIVGVAPKHRDRIGKHTLGILYMAWGEKAATAVKRSVATLKRAGFSYPICVVGDAPVDGFQFIKWLDESPFDISQKKNFQFRAGRIKPKLYDLSPFDFTLYLDADTEFVQDIQPGFEMLTECDIALTQEYLTVGELYNKFMAGWEINIEERAQTIKEGIPADENFINSGVIFFRKSENNRKLFQEWHRQWMRFQQWDEQLALMRALQHSKSSRKYLSPAWNDPQPHEDTIIFHDYGHGHVRMNK